MTPKREERLLSLQKSIDALVDLIPAKVYVATADEAFGSGLDKFSTHNSKKQSAPKQAIKEATKKARKWKLDPSSEAQTSTSEIVKQQPSDQTSVSSGLSAAVAGTTTASSIADLRNRVKEKIDDMRRKRGIAVAANKSKQAEKHGKTGAEGNQDESHTLESKKSAPAPRSRQEILERRLKKRNERQEKLKKKRQGEGVMGGSKKDVAASLGKSAVGQDALNFSRLNFTGKATSKETVTVNGAAPTSRLNKKHSDPKSLLAKLQNQNTKLEELATTNPTKHAAIVEKQKWEKAAAMAGGEVVRDDVKLVKKTVKKLEKRKDKSKGEWKDRIESVAKTMMDKQKKRNENLKARSDGKKKNGGLGVKKGGVKKGKGGSSKKRAGFEGGRKK
ncbi:surfeit locus protein 6-domain-containing protein [Chytriomyces sp. MP71]|nr:surfeit locus protein 6-domain-containing protein [Chytriomyces sp. MP71]